MRLVLPPVPPPAFLAPTNSFVPGQQTGPLVVGGQLSPEAVANNLVSQAVPELAQDSPRQIDIFPGQSTARALPLAGAAGSQGDVGTQLPANFNDNIQPIPTAEEQAAAQRAAGARFSPFGGATLEGAIAAQAAQDGFIAEIPERIPPAPSEEPIAVEIGATLVDGAFAFARAPIMDEVGNRRFNLAGERHPIHGDVRAHRGIDIGSASGTDIYPAAAGTVKTVAFQAGGAGNYIVVDHGNGFETKYFHMLEPSQFQVGDIVSPENIIGQVGSTGVSTGPHLHFETWQDGEPIDPMPLWIDALPPEQRVAYQNDTTIRSTQSVLADLGLYSGEIDGDFGPLSQRGLKDLYEAVTQDAILSGVGAPQ